MGFDMWAGARRDSIAPHEDELFGPVLAAPARFPELAALHARLYDKLTLAPEQAGRLVHELLALLDEPAPPTSTVLRLCRFYSAAWRAGHQIRCTGD